MTAPFTPRRRHGVEILDDPAIDPDVRVRSLADVARANALFGGTRAVLAELDLALRALAAREATLLDVGTGLGDIPRRAASRSGHRASRSRRHWRAPPAAMDSRSRAPMRARSPSRTAASTS